jgi:peptide-methionine (S)-S-oxide reductase
MARMNRFLTAVPHTSALAAACVVLAVHPSQAQPGTATAIFAGGCFWSMERAFDEAPGVVEAYSGYTGGKTVNPTYAQVVSGRTGHAEAVRVVYDPSKTDYKTLLEVYLHNVDPFAKNHMFCDTGSQYRSGIYFQNETEKHLAEQAMKTIEARFKHTPIVEIVPAVAFYDAEDYHQNFAKKNPGHYNAYREGCGQDRRLKAVWGADAGGHNG